MILDETVSCLSFFALGYADLEFSGAGDSWLFCPSDA